MNLEEAIANIGKEVTYIGNDKELIDDVFKDKKLIISEPTKRMATNVLIEYDELCFWNIDPRHLKLKEQPMQNYKIKVTPETNEEVQKLFFELGYEWMVGGGTAQHTNENYLITRGISINYTDNFVRFNECENQEINLPQLRDLVVVKRNDVSDATHIGRSGSQYHCVFGNYFFNGVNWVEDSDVDISKLTPIKIDSEMTWQDALRAVADGKEIEFYNDFSEKWHCIKGSYLYFIIDESFKFRLKPQTTHIEGGDYTKEELLKIAGEM